MSTSILCSRGSDMQTQGRSSGRWLFALTLFAALILPGTPAGWSAEGGPPEKAPPTAEPAKDTVFDAPQIQAMQTSLLLRFLQLAQAKRLADAEALLTGAVQDRRLDNAANRYNLACAQAVQGKTEAALASLAAAVERGWADAEHLRKTLTWSRFAVAPVRGTRSGRRGEGQTGETHSAGPGRSQGRRSPGQRSQHQLGPADPTVPRAAPVPAGRSEPADHDAGRAGRRPAAPVAEGRHRGRVARVPVRQPRPRPQQHGLRPIPGPDARRVCRAAEETRVRPRPAAAVPAQRTDDRQFVDGPGGRSLLVQSVAYRVTDGSHREFARAAVPEQPSVLLPGTPRPRCGRVR